MSGTPEPDGRIQESVVNAAGAGTDSVQPLPKSCIGRVSLVKTQGPETVLAIK